MKAEDGLGRGRKFLRQGSCDENVDEMLLARRVGSLEQAIARNLGKHILTVEPALLSVGNLERDQHRVVQLIGVGTKP